MDRINKFLAHAGVGSRRHCDTLIAAGRVKINDIVVTDLSTRVDPIRHKVFVDDHAVKAEKPVYWVVNKPVGVLCTNHDPAGRPRAIDLIPHVEQRVYTVGRLDEASEGMLLMTNDGDLAEKLMHPRYQIEKTYLVLVAGQPTRGELQKLLDGVWLSDGKVKAKRVVRGKIQGDSTWLRIGLCEGKNREIRRMLAKLGHKVMKLKRTAIGPVLLDRLPKGKARKLSLEELKSLQKLVTAGEKKLGETRGSTRSNKAGDSKPGG
jgi:23S rRNA pseudouridine2605 synthase